MNCEISTDELIVKGLGQFQRIKDFSDDQQRALDFVDAFMKSGRKSAVIGGIAGSGKSSIIPTIRERYRLDTGSDLEGVAVCAYTGKAVVVLKRKGLSTAQTLHSFLYKTEIVKEKNGDLKYVFIPKKPADFYGVRLLIVDEASMVNRQMHDFISTLPFKTLYIGDHFQLPPVGDEFNIMSCPDLRLETVLRQNEDNPIVQLAETVRNGGKIAPGIYGSSRCLLHYEVAELAEYDQVLAWTNQKVGEINDAIRKHRGFESCAPQYEEKMIVLANCPEKNVYNGQIVYVTNTPRRMSDGSYSVAFVDEFAWNDPVCGILAGEPMTARASVHLSRQEIERWRMLGAISRRKKDRKIGKIPNYEIHLDWGYCITVHKAQGSSWGNVAIIDERKMHWNTDYNRWLYTAITRAEESVTIYKI